MTFEATTLSSVLKRLETRGYTDTFRAESGWLVALKSQKRYHPEELSLDATYRFEGESDVDDEAAVFALSDSKDGIKGTYVVAFSTDMAKADSDMVSRLGSQQKPL